MILVLNFECQVSLQCRYTGIFSYSDRQKIWLVFLLNVGGDRAGHAHLLGVNFLDGCIDTLHTNFQLSGTLSKKVLILSPKMLFFNLLLRLQNLSERAFGRMYKHSLHNVFGLKTTKITENRLKWHFSERRTERLYTTIIYFFTYTKNTKYLDFLSELQLKI